MTTRDTPFAPGTPCWVDLMTSDYDKSKAFYTGLFGWTFEQSGEEFGDYVVFSSEGHSVAGMMHSQPDSGLPDLWSTYLASADIDKSVETATSAGAVVHVPIMDVGDVGRMAFLMDPAGGAFGLWQAGTHTGFGKYNAPGSVGWDEYHSKDFAASKEFYGKVFGYEWAITSDTDEFRYVTAKIDGNDVAGMMDSASFLPADVPSHWTLYFSVSSVDESVGRALELGGSVARPAEDTPFGRLADMFDATGANFKLHQPPAA